MKDNKIIIIPKGTKKINDREFSNNNIVEEIIIPDSVEHIGRGAFMNCKNLKKINLPKKLNHLEEDAFANCRSLTEITIPPTLHYIARGLFYYCINLKTINLHDNIDYIDDWAFAECHKLQEIKFPANLRSIGFKSFFRCYKIKELYIPAFVDSIEFAAFSFMVSLEKITVDKYNNNYTSDDDIVLISKQGIILQYALNSKNKSYKIGKYDINSEDSDYNIKSLIYNIAEFAFAGAKHLESIDVPSEIKSIGSNTFKNCKKLKTLNIYITPFGATFLCNIHNKAFNEVTIPFEIINIEEGITTLTDNLSELFKNATQIKLPSSLKHIGLDVFTKCSKIQKLEIPEGIEMILPDTFHEDMIIEIKNYITIKASELSTLETKVNEDATFNNHIKRQITKILLLKDGTYYVNIDDDIIKITKDEIKALSNSSFILQNDPDKFINYLYDLLSINADHSMLMQKVISNQELSNTFNSFITDLDFVYEISHNKHNRAIHEILKTADKDNPILFNGIIMRRLVKEEILYLLENMTPSLERFFKYSSYYNPNINDTKFINQKYIDVVKIVEYCNLLEKYQVYDRFLYDIKFIAYVPIEYQELIIKYYNANLKRLLISSKVLDNNNFPHNLNDLLKFLYIMGVFQDNERLSQKVTTFITEKMFTQNKPSGDLNEEYIVGDDIHRLFDDLKVKDIDYEFILFFIENYKDLILIEKTTSGFINRIYTSFKDISKCSSSDKGNQRHLKVTIEKCKNYLTMNMFQNVDEEHQDLAFVIGKFFSDQNILDKAIEIMKEAETAPRNIFTKVTRLNKNVIVYDNDPKHDLKGSVDIAFTWEWLPKQSYENLVLGKYCNCCAHVHGNGAGIMRASIILDCCQNLVIRDALGNIIAKMTLWVNKKEGYAIYNTVEMNLHNRNRFGIENVYNAFMDATKAFYETYNKNNPTNPIHTITIGINRNVLIDQLNKEKHPQIEPLNGINYSDYKYTIGNEEYGEYNGDHHTGQYLILSKKTQSIN